MLRYTTCICVLACGLGVSAADDEITKLTIVPGPLVPKTTSVVFTAPESPAPGQKGHKPATTITDFTKPIPLDGKVDVYVVTKGGIPVRLFKNWTPKKAELKLGDYLGSVYVRGDDLPRAEAVVVTVTDDPGPSEKGHVPIQQANDYKVTMLVPPGYYAVWVKPDNGTRSQKIADKIRVLAGRETQVPEE